MGKPACFQSALRVPASDFESSRPKRIRGDSSTDQRLKSSFDFGMDKHALIAQDPGKERKGCLGCLPAQHDLET